MIMPVYVRPQHCDVYIIVFYSAGAVKNTVTKIIKNLYNKWREMTHFTARLSLDVGICPDFSLKPSPATQQPF